jgi:K+-sensing histidine kinase KdpD
VIPPRPTTAEQRLEAVLAVQSLLANVSREIGPALELEAVLSTVLGAMRSLVDFRGGTIQLIEDNQVRVAAADPPVSPEVAAARSPLGGGLSGTAAATGQTVYSPDVDADPRVDQGLRKLGSNAGMKSYLAVPLVCLSRVIGVLQIDSERVDAFHDDDIVVLEGLATQVAGAIESARHYEKIVELEQLKVDFLGRVSHELRTPLTIISGFVDTLLNFGDDMDTRQRTQMLERVHSASNRLNHLIEELITVTQFEARAIDPHPTDLRVHDVLTEVRDQTIEPELVSIHCATDLRVAADPALLVHAVRLLVDNAIAYGGDAELSAGHDDEARVYIEVRDHGPGVPDELRGRIFERFLRGEHATPGMGLGLPLARTLAGGMEARLDLVDSERGARFRLTFS